MVELKKSIFFMNLFALIGLVSCANTPDADTALKADMPQFSTYQWQYFEVPDSAEALGSVEYSPVFAQSLEYEIDTIMQDRGYVGSDEPDIYLNYHMAIAKGKHYQRMLQIGPNSYRHNSVRKFSSPTTRYLDRTQASLNTGSGVASYSPKKKDKILVIVDAIDANTLELVWRSSTQIKNHSFPRDQEEMVKIAEEILADFPSI